ncbi:MAG: DUF3299 domain-containing protein [Rhodoferax sp.]|uniref:DUF3299 domain-containing protein n=1 Tax=Rhodoferax sp. TaxID=50421 RepID=UPI00263185DD|nr:DUF3299 domain-containing protein [Rhodoferax sp.]MDD2882064.1 DUF3299 domain-containing protein [Rhodoferax sp.]
MKPFEFLRQKPREPAGGAKSAALALVLSACLLPLGSLAQLSSPIAGGAPAGTGPGVHSPNSPFAPLPQRADVLPWSVLTDVKTRVVNKRLLPSYSADVQALNDKPQRIQGFMMPLEPGEKQKHFLLTSVPLTCSFCTPGGPESMVEVFTKTPVKYTMEPVVVDGRLSVLADDPYGLYYRIKDAVLVK